MTSQAQQADAFRAVLRLLPGLSVILAHTPLAAPDATPPDWLSNAYKAPATAAANRLMMKWIADQAARWYGRSDSMTAAQSYAAQGNVDSAFRQAFYGAQAALPDRALLLIVANPGAPATEVPSFCANSRSLMLPGALRLLLSRWYPIKPADWIVTA